MKDDLIRRRELLEHLHRKVRSGNDVNIDKEMLEFPAVDAVEVVRCGDCIFKNPPQLFGSAIIGEIRCSILGTPMNFNDFCSYGEKRGRK